MVMGLKRDKNLLLKIYKILRNRFGHQEWWPGDSPFEVMIGAILTQNTAWKNVEKAIANLKSEGLLSYEGLIKCSMEKLAFLVRPSGYYNQKAKKLKNFLSFMEENFGGSIDSMKRVKLDKMRKMLLEVNGIGPETADSILLYALAKRIFVVDAYTKRIFSRIGLIESFWNYEKIQAFFMDNLSSSLPLYNDYHAQIVMFGKEICRTRPKCDLCPLIRDCRFGRGVI
jgi:endonuclease III related protein